MRDAQLPCVFPGSPWLLVENGGGGLKMPKTGMLERLRGWLAEHVGVRRQAVWEMPDCCGLGWAHACSKEATGPVGIEAINSWWGRHSAPLPLANTAPKDSLYMTPAS